MASTTWALILFTLASVTDFLDGYLARKYNLITPFGKIMDPIADKFLVLSAFFIFMQMRLIPAWMFIVIAAREIIVTGLRFLAVGKNMALAAEAAGKFKTVLQIIAIYLIIITVILGHVQAAESWYRVLMEGLFKGIFIMMCVVVLVTLWSGLSFIANNRKEIFRA